jgi:lia operon protein LiaG
MPVRRAVLLALIPLLASLPLAGQGTRYTVSGRDVAIYNLAGIMRVEPGTGSAVVVEVTRRGDDAAKLQVETGPISGRETLRVIYPSDRIVYSVLGRHSQSQIRVREDGTFNGHDGRDVRISGDGSGLDASADLRVLVPSGQRVAVNLAVGRVSVSNVNGQLSVDASSADVDASGTKGSLSIDVGSGDVKVTGADGVLSVDTGSGNVTLSDVRGGEVGIDTGSGDVSATTLGAHTLKVDTGSGNVTLSGVATEDASIETGSGDIRLDVDATLRTFHGETGSGDVTIRAPASLSAALDIESSSGEIESDFEVAVTRREADHLVGRIGSGTGRISVDTGSGSVRLLRK